MSRAFVKEDAAQPDEDPPERPVSELPNYVTRSGLRALEAREQALLDELAGKPEKKRKKVLERDLRYVQSRLQTAIPVAAAPKDEIRFGADVALKAKSGLERRLRIVGEDEAAGPAAAAAAGGTPPSGAELVSWASPFAHALLGLKTGQSFDWEGESGAESWTVVSVGYES